MLQALRPSAVESVGVVEAMRRAFDDAAQRAGWSSRFVDRIGDGRLPAAVETANYTGYTKITQQDIREGLEPLDGEGE